MAGLPRASLTEGGRVLAGWIRRCVVAAPCMLEHVGWLPAAVVRTFRRLGLNINGDLESGTCMASCNRCNVGYIEPRRRVHYT